MFIFCVAKNNQTKPFLTINHFSYNCVYITVMMIIMDLILNYNLKTIFLIKQISILLNKITMNHGSNFFILLQISLFNNFF